MNHKKAGFSSKIGFILATAGSAVGLGNLWRFPYLAAHYGGGTFLLVYVLLTVTFGFTLLVTEIAIGKHTGKSALSCYRHLDHRFGFLGILNTLVPLLVFPYYCVIGGWVLKYLSVYLFTSEHAIAEDNFFHGYISQTMEPILWMVLFVLLTCFIVSLGVKKGIEKTSKVFMPLLVILIVFIVCYVLTIPGAMEGVKYYLTPDFSKISMELIIAAVGQLFYSMSLAMGIMITYGSYMPDDENIESSVRKIELFDCGIAILSGLLIIPAVFAFWGADEATLSSGPSLMFITLPKIFESLRLGKWIGLLFFILALLAAITSAISMLEALIYIFTKRFHIKRRKACLYLGIYTVIMALPSTLGYGVWSHIEIMGRNLLEAFDYISNSILMPLLAIGTCILIGYVVKPKLIEETVTHIAPDYDGAMAESPKAEDIMPVHTFRSKRLYNIMIKYVAPVLLALIVLTAISDVK